MKNQSLKDFTDAQLIAELMRRENAKVRLVIENFCDDCINFRPWNRDVGIMPDEYNPCSKRHKMNFKLPEGHDDPHGGNFGFYLNCCPDSDFRDVAE